MTEAEYCSVTDPDHFVAWRDGQCSGGEINCGACLSFGDASCGTGTPTKIACRYGLTLDQFCLTYRDSWLCFETCGGLNNCKTTACRKTGWWIFSKYVCDECQIGYMKANDGGCDLDPVGGLTIG